MLLSPNVKRCGLSLWTNLNPLYPGMLFAKFGWNWPSGYIKKGFFNFSLFCNYLHLEKSEALHLNILIYLSPKDDLCQVWLKLTQWFCRRRFLKSINVFSLFRNYLPLEKGRGLHLNKLEPPSPKDVLCQVWLKLAQWFWKRRFF